MDLGCSDWLTEAEVFLEGPGMGGSALIAAQQDRYILHSGHTALNKSPQPSILTSVQPITSSWRLKTGCSRNSSHLLKELSTTNRPYLGAEIIDATKWWLRRLKVTGHSRQKWKLTSLTRIYGCCNVWVQPSLTSVTAFFPPVLLQSLALLITLHSRKIFWNDPR